MGFKKWCVSEFDKTLAKQLAEECEIDPIVALIASARGYTDPMDLEQFLSDEPCFSDFYEMADIIKAAEILNTSLENGEKIAVYGDYDCDGVTATALFCNYLKLRNANFTYYIPDRFSEGYGMNCQAVEKLYKSGVKLIITVDNGISCLEEISLAKSLGMKVIVTDHHLPSINLPEADAVVDPHRTDCPSAFKAVCGAQVAFRLICVTENKEPEELLPFFADILSLAVIADIMPLTLENRSIVKCGIEKLKTSPIKGLSALIGVAGINIADVNASKIAFGLAPRINAAGRMGKADRAVELLMTENITEALALANEIDSENALRQQTEKKIFEEAVNIIENNGYMHNRVIVVSGEGWHQGVIGIVASKITERYGKACVLISSCGELAHGSGRSIEGFSLYNAIADSKDLTVKFGGHDQAAGITLATENIDEFRHRINIYAEHFDYVPPVLKLDCKLNPSALSLDLAFALEQLEPFGNGNNLPVFGVYGCKLIRITPIGNGKHLRLLFTKGDNTFQALLFGVTVDNFCFALEDILDLAVTVDSNFYKGEYSVSVTIKAIRMSGTDDDRLFKDFCLFDDFLSGAEVEDISSVCPTRTEVGEVYKFISHSPVLPDRVKYLFLNKLGLGKTLASIKTLEELNLIVKDASGKYCAAVGVPKTALTNSETYKKLTERSGVL